MTESSTNITALRKPPSFSLAIDATKVPELLELSSEYKAVIGAEYPNHLIDISSLNKDEVNAIVQNKPQGDGKKKCGSQLKKTPATEIKIAMLTFQPNGVKGISPTTVVAACPQENNESNDFIIKTLSYANQAMKNAGVSGTSLLNFVVDGVSCESR